MPSLETYNLLVVTYDVWLPDKILGIAPRSFWKIFPRLLSLPFPLPSLLTKLTSRYHVFILIPLPHKTPLVISSHFKTQNSSSSTVAWLWMIVHM